MQQNCSLKQVRFLKVRERRPFIPRDKPKSGVIFILACLVGLAIGLVGFAAAWAGISWLKSIFMLLFFTCWLVAAASWFVLMFGMLTGRYRNMQPKEWREQLW